MTRMRILIPRNPDDRMLTGRIGNGVQVGDDEEFVSSDGRLRLVSLIRASRCTNRR